MKENENKTKAFIDEQANKVHEMEAMLTIKTQLCDSKFAQTYLTKKIISFFQQGFRR
jgi:hypothetical protein